MRPESSARNRPRRALARGLACALATLLLAALLPAPARAAKHLAPVPAATLALMAKLNVAPAAPILMRSYKLESEIEVWKQARDGRYVLLKTFPICRWSGQLGPKTKVGDRQAPEGFYAVTPGQMNPNSSYHLSFDLGYPNAFDRAHGRTGSHLMVHGACSSAGCFAMTDEAVSEIFALAREAFAGGQAAFQFQSYPFRMTARNLARHRTDPNMPFWRQLKEGSDRFEALREEPQIGVAAGRYAFAPARDPAKEARVAAYREAEATKLLALIDEGSAAVRTTYADGALHPSFLPLFRRGALGEVSRPEALAYAAKEVTLIPAKPKKREEPVQVAEVQVVAVPAAPLPGAPAILVPLSEPEARPRAPRPPREPSVFAFAALGPAAVPAPSRMAGSARILPPGFAPAVFVVASR